MSADIDKALGIHLDLIQFFRDGHCTTSTEIANRYGISQRSAQRYIARVERYVPLQRNGNNYRKMSLR